MKAIFCSNIVEVSYRILGDVEPLAIKQKLMLADFLLFTAGGRKNLMMGNDRIVVNKKFNFLSLRELWRTGGLDCYSHHKKPQTMNDSIALILYLQPSDFTAPHCC